jgi:lipopolysaccharide biosynthesis glycosyltransferase
MNVVYASDDNFADIMGVSIVSLLENNKDAESINIFVLDNNITIENKEKLTSLVSCYQRQLHIITMPDMHRLVGVRIIPQRVPLSAFSRLFLPLILPEKINKILYIDCDTIIDDSIEALYNEDIGETCGAGVLDCMSKGHRKSIGLDATEKYFNSGILLINLKKWREDDICNKFIDFIILYNGNVPYEDQGTVNGVIGRYIKIVSPVYNAMTVGFDFPSYKMLCQYRKPSQYYTEHEYLKSVTEPVIVHFATSYFSLRPWVEGCRHPYAEEWLRYKALTPWKDKPLRKDNRSGKKKMLVWMYRVLPKPIAISCAGWLHTVVVPWRKSKRQRSLDNIYNCWKGKGYETEN